MFYKTITAGELRKMDGKRCRLKTDMGVIIEDGIISIDEDGYCFVAHNNKYAVGGRPDDRKGKKYGWNIYLRRDREDDKHSDNYNYKWINIEEEETKEETKEQNQTYTYKTQILRSDGVLFEEDKIDGELISEIQKRHNRDGALLRKHKDLFSKKFTNNTGPDQTNII